MSDHAGNQPADQQDQRVEDALDAGALADDAGQDAGQDEGLDDMVSRLLSELDDACDAAERSLADDDAAEAASATDAKPPEPAGEQDEATSDVANADIEHTAEEEAPAPAAEVAQDDVAENDTDDADANVDSPTIGEVDDAADLDDAVAALTEELMGDDSSPVAEPTPPTEAAAAPDAPEADVADELATEPEAPTASETPTADASAAEPEPVAAPAPAPAADTDDALGGLGDLDDAIAALTSELIDGEFLDAAGESAEVDAPPGASAPAEPAPSSEATPAAASEPAAAAPPATPDPGAPPPAAPADEPATTATAREPKPAKAKPSWKPKLVAAFVTAKAMLSTLTVKAAPLGEKVARLMSAPLNSKPKAVRDLIGWAGLITVFYAACLWFVVLFLRSPQVPMAEGVPTGLVADTSQAATSTD